MNKIIINSDILKNRIAELEKEREITFNPHKLTSIEAKISELQSILQQGEEYNENKGSFDEEGYGVTRVIDNDSWDKIYEKFMEGKSTFSINQFIHHLNDNYNPLTKR